MIFFRRLKDGSRALHPVDWLWPLYSFFPTSQFELVMRID